MINNKYKKMTVTCVVLSLFILIGLSVPICQAEAQTFEQRIPNYGLYCSDADVIKSGTVKFDMTDSELLEQGAGKQKSEYCIAETNHEVEFTIPFILSARNVPTISVAVDGRTIEGSIWYGEGVFGTDNIFDIEAVYTASTADGFYFVFSSSEKPINKMSENNENETRKIVLIVCIVVGSIVVILFVIAIGIMVYKRKRFIL